MSLPLSIGDAIDRVADRGDLLAPALEPREWLPDEAAATSLD
jgi:hypothetical protein